MATAPRIDPGDIVSLDPKEIQLGERLRPIDLSWATAIGQSMKRDGQIHSVDVRPLPDGTFALAGAGGHRVTGARLAGIPIDVRVVVFDKDFSRRREAAENLFRRTNDPLERAEAVAELVRLHREKAGLEEADHREQSLPKRLRSEVDGTCATIAHVYGWADEVAAEIGLSKRTIQYDLATYRGLKASIVGQLRAARHPILKNASQLRALARLDGAEQSAVADRLLGGARSIAEAQAAISNRPAASAEDRRLSAFIGAFARMGLAEKKGALRTLVGLLPAGVKLVEAR